MMRKQNLYKKFASGFIYIILFGLMLSSCTNNESKVGLIGLTSTDDALYYATEEAEEASSEDQLSYGYSTFRKTPDAPTTHTASKVIQAPKSLKVIKSGSMQYQVEHLEEAKAELNYLVNKYEAYYSSEKLDHQSYQKVYQLNIRIPSANYEAFIQDMEKKGLGELLDKQINAQDVSEEYVDLETRLKNKRAYIDRYNGLLKQAKNMEDVLKIQEKIRALEEEIDRAQGRLRFLADRVGYGTLNVMLQQEIEEDVVVVEDDTFIDKFVDSVSFGWNGLLGFILVIIALWPWLILIAAALIVFRRWRKKRKNYRNQ